MNDLIHLLSRLKHNNVKLEIENDRVIVRSFDGDICNELLEDVKVLEQEIVEFLRKKAKKNPVRITRIEDQEYYELSSSQEGFWFMEQLQKHDTAFLQHGLYVIEGSFNYEAALRSFEHVFKRHEILRVIFVEVNGLPKLKFVPWDQMITPLELFEIENDEIDVLGEISKYSQEKIDLSKGPLLQGRIYKRLENQYYFYYKIHHIISDGWSMGILINEIVQVYNQILDEEDIVLPELSIQYRDFSVWQKRYVNSVQGKILKEFWVDYLGGDLPVISLPTYKPRPPVLTSKGKVIDFHIPIKQVEALKMLGIKYRCTFFMTLISLVNLLLYKYTGQCDILIGSDFGGRLPRQVENNLGLFLDAFVIRTVFDENGTFTDLLKEVGTSVSRAYDHRFYPLTKIIKDLGLVRDPSRNAFFDVIVGLKNFDDRVVDELLSTKEIDNDLRITSKQMDANTAVTDLNFSFWEDRDVLVMGLSYNTDLFESGFVQQMGEHFLRLVEKVVINPDIVINSISFFDSEDKMAIESDVRSVTSKDLEKHLFQIIIEKEREMPHAIAIVSDHVNLTYRSLLEDANQLAVALFSLGVSSGDFVPIFQNQSINYVVASLAIMRIGAIVSPISTFWSIDQINDTLNQTLHAKLALIDDSSRHLLDALEIPCFTCEELLNVGVSEKIKTLVLNDELFSIFTSGTLGQPKGVLLQNHSILNRLLWMNEQFGCEAANAVLYSSPNSFDASVWQVLWPLINGGKIIVPGNNIIYQGVVFSKLVGLHKVKICDFVPSIFSKVLDELLNEKLSLAPLDHLILGGEEINANIVQKFKRAYTNVNVTNLYGPAEATIGCIFHSLSLEEENRIPIGKPISNTKVYLLDKSLRPVPSGVKGEIYLSGACITKGYINNLEETEKSFLPNPFDDDPQFSVIYKTGDFGIFERDAIYYLGREDAQIKVRGVRIDLIQVKKALMDLKLMRDVVIGVEEHGGNENLVAYCVCDDQVEDKLIIRELSGYVPHYMIPKVYRQIDEIPTTPNGKVDMQKLSSLGECVKSAVQEPVTEIEKFLVETCAEILQVKEISMSDNFFTLGGNSLAAIELIQRINEVYPEKMRISDVFSLATIQELSLILEDNYAKIETQ